MEMNTNTIARLTNEIGADNLPVLLGIFISELQQYSMQLTQAADSDQIASQFQEICHALKSSAASFGAEDLCQLSTLVDNEVKDGRYHHQRDRVDTFLQTLHRTLSCYQQFLVNLASDSPQ